MEEESGGGIIGETSGSIWELSERHLGEIWEAFGRHLGVIREAFGGLEAEEASGRHLEVRSQKLQYLSAKMQKLH